MSTGIISDRRIQHWGGAAFVFGNLLFIANKLNEMSRLFLGRPMPDVISGQNPGLIVLGQVALIIGYVAYYRFYSRRVGRCGQECAPPAQRRRYRVDVWACQLHVRPGGFSSPGLSLCFSSVIVGLMFLLGGLIWFGILNLHRQVLSRCPGCRWLPG